MLLKIASKTLIQAFSHFVLQTPKIIPNMHILYDLKTISSVSKTSLHFTDNSRILAGEKICQIFVELMLIYMFHSFKRF